jgi:ATP-dependent RNA helicase RhlE
LIPHSTPVAEPSAFAPLGLSPASLESLARAGYSAPTPIQAQAIPPGLAGKDIIGCAATGTGKTAAFLLPIIERLRGQRGARALILAPTRELVIQIADHLEKLGRGTTFVEIVGGVGFQPQTVGLREGRTVVIATPGRLIDHMERGNARLEQIEVLVLDEADRMLDMGFKPQLDRILARVPKQRQTMLFSATMAGEVAGFARACLSNPVKVEIVKSGTMAARAEQKVYFVPQQAKTDLLLALLAQDDLSTLVFTRTKHRADRLAKVLHRAGHKVSAIHGGRSQGQRQTALDGFKSGRYRVLVATDIAARGIDVEEIGHVVNLDISRNPEDHVHRVGRTARAEKSGRASSFCSPEEAGLLRAIEKFTRTQIPRGETPKDLTPFKAPPAPPKFAPDNGLVPVETEKRDEAPRETHHRPHPRRPHHPHSHSNGHETRHGEGAANGHGGPHSQGPSHGHRARRPAPWHLRERRRGRPHPGAQRPR